PSEVDHTPLEKMVDHFRSPKPWNHKDRDDVIARLKNLHPYYDTPLVRAMADAYDADLSSASEGFKMLLVLTDGVDTRFRSGKGHGPDPKYNKENKPIPDFLRSKFGNSQVFVNVVIFQASKEETEEAEKQFKVLEDLPTPGWLLSAKDTAQLTNRLRDGI